MTAIENSGLVETTDFPYDQIDGSPEVSADDEFWQLLSEALSVVLAWQTAPAEPIKIGQRTMVLALWLRPGLLKEQSLLAIARSAARGYCRASLSHALLKFQEQYQAGHARFQRLEFMRERYRRSRIASHLSRKEEEAAK
jgi:hypothetical protein